MTSHCNFDERPCYCLIEGLAERGVIPKRSRQSVRYAQSQERAKTPPRVYVFVRSPFSCVKHSHSAWPPICTTPALSWRHLVRLLALYNHRRTIAPVAPRRWWWLPGGFCFANVDYPKEPSSIGQQEDLGDTHHTKGMNWAVLFFLHPSLPLPPPLPVWPWLGWLVVCRTLACPAYVSALQKCFRIKISFHCGPSVGSR